MTYYQKNKEKIKATALAWLGEHQEVRLYNSCKINAKNRNIPFTLKLEDIEIPERCPLLGIKLTNIMGKGRQQTNASIDRIDSSKGYSKDNIQIISDLANRMKQEATPEQLLEFAHNIIYLYN